MTTLTASLPMYNLPEMRPRNAAFWDALKAAAVAEHVPVARLIARIDATRGASGLSSAVRVWVLQHYREGARRGGRA